MSERASGAPSEAETAPEAGDALLAQGREKGRPSPDSGHQMTIYNEENLIRLPV